MIFYLNTDMKTDQKEKFYDIHAHLADSRLDGKRQDVIERALKAGVDTIVCAAARASEWDRVVELSRHPSIIGALGIHPFFVDDSTDELDRLETFLTNERTIRCIAEIGLDYWNGRDNREKQLEVFRFQLDLAVRRNLPVVVHNRKSWNDFIGIWREQASNGIPGICHCFNGSKELARQLLDAGLYLSFGGPATYQNARKIRDVVRFVPEERLLTETDCPDLPAQPFRERRWSEPADISVILSRIAEIRCICPIHLQSAVESNFKKIFPGP